MKPRTRIALRAALACGVALAGLALLALVVPAGHERDAAILHGFVDLATERRTPVLQWVADLANPLPYALAAVTIVGVALVRRRAARAGVVAVLLLITGATTQVLKHVLAEPRIVSWLTHSPSESSWPSGHATAAMTLALCAVLVAPPALRWLTALCGALFAVAVGIAIVVLHWHYPSDVLGGFLVAGTWTALGAAVLAQREHVREPGLRPREQSATWLMPVAMAVAVLGVVVMARGDDVAIYALERPSVAVAAAAIAALAAALPAGAARV